MTAPDEPCVCGMNNHTVAALEQAAYNLRDEANRAERRAAALSEEADAFRGRALGLRSAAQVIDQALAEEAS